MRYFPGGQSAAHVDPENGDLEIEPVPFRHGFAQPKNNCLALALRQTAYIGNTTTGGNSQIDCEESKSGKREDKGESRTAETGIANFCGSSREALDY
ncbi:hypothetical protein KM043_017150 [Ampulex compressa]|nr:hypothetical protein KM043_017150 [Ampulex compressa]